MILNGSLTCFPLKNSEFGIDVHKVHLLKRKINIMQYISKLSHRFRIHTHTYTHIFQLTSKIDTNTFRTNKCNEKLKTTTSSQGVQEKSAFM